MLVTFTFPYNLRFINVQQLQSYKTRVYKQNNLVLIHNTINKYSMLKVPIKSPKE